MTSILSSSIPASKHSRSSCLVVKRGGMVVFCAGTTGYNITFDARYVWMRQKRIRARTSPISRRRARPTA